MGKRSSLAWTPGFEINAKVRKDGVAWPKAGDVQDRPIFLDKQTVSLRLGHQGAPTRRRICLPATPPSKRVSLPLSLRVFSLWPALSPSPLFLILLPVLSLRPISLFLILFER